MSANVPATTPVAEDGETNRAVQRSRSSRDPGDAPNNGTKNERRIDQLEAIVAQQTATISDLVKEIQETNHWMKRLLSEKGPDNVEHNSGAEDVSASPIAGSGLRAAEESGEPNGPTATPPTREQKIEALRRAFEKRLSNWANNEFVADAWRREFLGRLEKWPAFDGGDEAGSVVAKATEFKTLSGTETLQIAVNPLPTRLLLPDYHSGDVRIEAMQVHLDKWWPRGSAALLAPHHFFFDEYSSWRVATGERALLVGFLLLQGAGDRLVQAQLGIDTPWDGNEELTAEACVGAVWFLPVYDGRIGFDLISRLAPCVFSQKDCFVLTDPPATRHLPHFAQYLSEFATGWHHYLARFPGTISEEPINRLEGGTSISHAIRVFSTSDPKKSSSSVPFLKCVRESGQLSILRGLDIVFFERRQSLLFTSDRHFFRNHPNRHTPKSWPQSRLLLIYDAAASDDLWGGPDFANWEKRGFTARGERSAFMLFQSTVHAVLVWWEREWSESLDSVDTCVRVKLFDVLGGSHSGNAENFMFDNSFRKSRVYFQALQALRIFSETIRETGRHLHQLSDDLERRSKQWFGDGDIRNNWKIVMNFQADAEARLLRRIGEKTEEIKSLRDGLFNATSLLEASRSTTMNRYIIIFTIVTVIFLPPSFVATVYGTDLFNSEDTDGTISKFKFTTVGVSLFTYLVAILLVWLADRTSVVGIVRAAYIYPWMWFKKLLKWLGFPRSQDRVTDSDDDEGTSATTTSATSFLRFSTSPHRSVTGNAQPATNLPGSSTATSGPSGSTSATRTPWWKLSLKPRRPKSEDPEV